jgi:hypothetical protein
MSVGVARWVLWVVFVLVVPLPFYLVQTGTVPAARIGMLAGVHVALVAAEGAQGTAGILAAILVAQAVVYGALLWWAAHRISRLLARAWPRRIGAATAALVVACVLVAVSFDVYRTPFRARSLRANLLQVFE